MPKSGPRSTGSPLAPASRPPASPRRPGLDPTTFNKSKRITPDGRARWPSTESVAKSLAATGTSIDIFVQLIEDTAIATTRRRCR